MHTIIRIDLVVIIVNKSIIIFQCKWRVAYIMYQRAFWRFAEIQRIAVEKSAVAITSVELELSPGPEDQFPIIRGTRIYIRERGNKYGVYTAVHLHGTDAAQSFSAQRWEGAGINSWPPASISGFRSRFVRYKWTPPTTRGTAKLRNYGTKWTYCRRCRRRRRRRHRRRQWQDAKEREHVAVGVTINELVVPLHGIAPGLSFMLLLANSRKSVVELMS